MECDSSLIPPAYSMQTQYNIYTLSNEPTSECTIDGLGWDQGWLYRVPFYILATHTVVSPPDPTLCEGKGSSNFK